METNSTAGNVKAIARVERTPRGLADALFDSMDKLNAGTSSVEECRAIANTARVIVGVARLEIEAVRLADGMGKRVQFGTLPGLGESVVTPKLDNKNRAAPAA